VELAFSPGPVGQGNLWLWRTTTGCGALLVYCSRRTRGRVLADPVPALPDDLLGAGLILTGRSPPANLPGIAGTPFAPLFSWEKQGTKGAHGRNAAVLDAGQCDRGTGPGNRQIPRPALKYGALTMDHQFRPGVLAQSLQHLSRRWENRRQTAHHSGPASGAFSIALSAQAGVEAMPSPSAWAACSTLLEGSGSRDRRN
jgi:hypothetical protein